LQAGLASLGYAVSGGTDPGALVALANSDARPADAVLIDAGWLQNEASASLMENLFSARNVPCVTMQGEVRRARQAIDKLLEVVV
jgi:tRNA(Ile)-lysidine synthase TilS/MesJ